MSTNKTLIIESPSNSSPSVESPVIESPVVESPVVESTSNSSSVKESPPVILSSFQKISSSEESPSVIESPSNSSPVVESPPAILSSIQKTSSNEKSTSLQEEEQEQKKKEKQEEEQEEKNENANLKQLYQEVDCEDENYYSKGCNQFLLKKELVENQYLADNQDEYDYLYPSLNDPNFIVKIAEKKEFNDTQYDGKIHSDVKAYADLLSKIDFELSPHQAFVRNFLSSQTPYNSLLLYHGLGSGKCHAKGTKIMMHDGSIKLVEEIKEGELLMGDDSKPRKVLSLANGIDKMYDIIPVKGDKYTVNEDHILCLRVSGFPKICHNQHKNNTNFNIQWIENNIFQSKTFSYNIIKNNQNEMKVEAERFYENIKFQTTTQDNIIEISVKNYLLLSEKKKSLLKGYKVPIDFSENILPFDDPYMIGYWLGDGTSRDSAITCQDSTVLHYFAHNLAKYKLALFHRSEYTYGISGSGKVNGNILFTTLKKLNLINNKHIPSIYLFNSRENRMKLLAGLLDSDGYLNKEGNCFEFSQKNENMIDDVIFLVRSLGFACYKSEKKTSWNYKGINFGKSYRINISGSDIEKIPTKIPRKKANLRNQKKDVLVTGIQVKYKNDDEYYGFTLDGNGRYLLSDFTVTHNTCSAIGVCEEMRDYSRQVGLAKRIIIVASKNVQDNFRLQLFDERKLKNTDGIWNIKGCIGNKLLKEINPSSVVGLSREKIISQIKNLINSSYLFLGYGQFANYIIKTASIDTGSYKNEKEKMKKAVRQIKAEFDGRLIVIDEVHNIRITEDNENKHVAINLELLVKSADNLRLLLLSATPMYNSYKEIVWLINLMNINDRRGKIMESSIFDKNGNIKEEGKEILIRKATGYISFVRGENPYTFPYRVYPSDFALENTFKEVTYPITQMNGRPINDEERLKILDLFLVNIGEYQEYGYKFILDNIKSKNTNVTTKKGEVRIMPTFEEMEKFGYTLLQKPLEALIIVYPLDGLKEVVNQEVSLERNNFIDPNELTGKDGLKRIMNFRDEKNPPEKGSFEYKSNKYGNIFSPPEIGKYSCKIKNILNNIVSPSGEVSEGVILIYSQYIDGGLIPVALALEEMGFTRFGENSKNLFKNAPSQKVDVRTMKPRAGKEPFIPARYIMITGDTRLSPNNDFEVKGATNEDNINGNKVKVILISKAGSEGIDLKFIRQVHILEPWYNMNRVEQIIGRAVRNFSHKDLPFEKRNVEIFMYATILENKENESVDIYIYRVAENKAIQIGKVSRILKETSVDCIINHEQTNFTREFMNDKLKEPITQILSNGKVMENFKIGDVPYTAACDYMSTCEYSCYPNVPIEKIDINEDSYNEAFIMINLDKVIQKIKLLMKENFFYKKNVLLELIDIPKTYPLVQKYAALTQLIEDNNEFITDKYGRTGHLINIGEYYLFQPHELNFKNTSIFDRSVPIDYKHESIKFEIKNNISENVLREIKEEQTNISTGKSILDDLQEKYELAVQFQQKDSVVKRGDDNWYKFCGIAIRRLTEGGMNSDILDELLVDHLLDSLLFSEKKEVINYLYSNDINENTFLEKAMNYFHRNTIVFQNKFNSKTTTSILLYNIHEKEEILILLNGIWQKAEPEDIRELMEAANVREKWIIKNQKLSSLIGFMGYEKQNRYLVFKIKDMKSKRNSGARCDEGGKAKTLKMLNEVVGEERYTNESTKGLVQTELCCLLEMIMRYYNRMKIDDKIWFLNSDVALFNKF